MNIWICSHECSGISEAGGVKNVTFSLCKEFQKLGSSVTLFIPKFKCTSFKEVQIVQENVFSTEIPICQKNEIVSFTKGKSKNFGFNIVFVEHPCFSEKEAVYTYTASEENLNPFHKKGNGHEDSKFMNVLFAKAVSLYGKFIQDNEKPDVIHCQDASTALIPLFIKNNPLESMRDVKTLVTIHNAGPAYHHNFANIDEASWYTGFDETCFVNCLNQEKPEPFLIASEYGAVLTTVSPDYARELTDSANDSVTDGLSSVFQAKKINIIGITNGIDIESYDPSQVSSSFLPYAFSPENLELSGKKNCLEYLIRYSDKESENLPEYETLLVDIKKHGFLLPVLNSEKAVYLCYQGRLATQKGLNVLVDAIPFLVSNFPDLRVIITGQGEAYLEEKFINLSRDFPGKLLFLNGYNKLAARLTVAGSDFIALPSNFEPCGLEDFIAQIFGTVPVAHKTGGLNKIENEKTGFLYSNNEPASLIAKLSEVISIKINNPSKINEIIRNGAQETRSRYNWGKVVQNDYVPLLNELLKK